MADLSKDYNELLSLLKSHQSDTECINIRKRFDTWYILHDDYDQMVEIIHALNDGMSDKEIRELIEFDYNSVAISNRKILEMENDLLKYDDMSAVEIEIKSARDSINDAIRHYKPSKTNVKNNKNIKHSSLKKVSKKSKSTKFDIIEEPVYVNRYNELLAYIKLRNPKYSRKEKIESIIEVFDDIDKSHIDILSNRNLSDNQFSELTELFNRTDLDSKCIYEMLTIVGSYKVDHTIMKTAISSINLISIEYIRQFVKISSLYNIKNCVIDIISYSDISKMNKILKYNNKLIIPFLTDIDFYNNINIDYIDEGIKQIPIDVIKRSAKYYTNDKLCMHQIEIGILNGLHDYNIEMYKDMRAIDMWIARMLLEHGKSLDNYSHIFKHIQKIPESILKDVLGFMFDIGFTIEIMVDFLSRLKSYSNELEVEKYDKDGITKIINAYINDMNKELNAFYRSNYFYTNISEIYTCIKSGMTKKDAFELVSKYAPCNIKIERNRFL